LPKRSEAAPLPGWEITARSRGAIRCSAFGFSVYVAREDRQAEQLRRGRDRIVFTREELRGRTLREMNLDEMGTWLRMVVSVRSVLAGAKVVEVRALD